MGPQALRRYLWLAAAILAAGLSAAMLGWLGAHRMPWPGRDALMAAGGSLILAGAWQLWTLWRTRILVEQQAQALTQQLELMTLANAAKDRARDALRKALSDNEAIMQAFDRHAIVSEADGQGCLTAVNRHYCDISGYVADELLGRNCSVVGSGWHPPAFWRSVWQHIGQGRSWTGEVCNRSKQGRLYWLKTLIVPFADEDGRVLRFVAIQADITEHRHAQTELRKSQVLLSRTNRIAGVGGWYVIRETGGLQMTAECQDLLGTQDGDIRQIGDLWRCFEQGAQARVREQLAQLVDGSRREVDFVAPLRNRSSGMQRWLRVVAGAGDDDPGRGVGRIVGAVQDFTQQVLAQKRVLEEQRILHSAMDAVGEAFALYDQSNRLVYFNDEYAALLPDGDCIRQGMAYEDVLRFIAQRGDFKDAVGREQAWVREVLMAPLQQAPNRIRQTADGRWIRFVDRLTPDGYRVVFRYDVTELQNALIQADAASRSKGQFLANMSHEIRTPIHAIMGLLQLLGHTRLDPAQADMQGKALNASRSLLQILNDILDYSKVEAGKMVLYPVAFEIRAMCVELEVVLGGAVGTKPVRLSFEVDPVLPPILVGDPVRLKQVLINLGGNAIKFTDRGWVRIRLRRLSVQEGRVRVRVEVEDTGIGIAPEQQEHIFNSFAQVEGSTSRRFGGTGLGLTISQRLVQLMGGQISLRSVPGAGSTFAFELDMPVGHPKDLVDATPAGGVEPGTLRLTGIRILLVEDNVLNQEVALAMLRREGAEVDLAVNGAQAVDWLRAHPHAVDLVLMDMQMPVLDGLQATECIRQELGLKALPILAMTANAMQADRERCLNAGMNGHIGKPFDLDQVVHLVKHFTSEDKALKALPLDLELEIASQDKLLLEDEAALRRLGGDRTLLDQLRQRFVQASGELMRQALGAASRHHWPQVVAAVHQLKGNAAVVGADALADACVRAETSLRSAAGTPDAARCAADLDMLQGCLHRTQVALGAHPTDRPTLQEGTLSSDEELISDLLSLKSLLESSDMASIDQHDSILQKYPQSHGEAFRALNQCMSSLDLPAAEVATVRLLQELSTS